VVGCPYIIYSDIELVYLYLSICFCNSLYLYFPWYSFNPSQKLYKYPLKRVGVVFDLFCDNESAELTLNFELRKWLVSTEWYGTVQFGWVRNYLRFHCQKL